MGEWIGPNPKMPPPSPKASNHPCPDPRTGRCRMVVEEAKSYARMKVMYADGIRSVQDWQMRTDLDFREEHNRDKLLRLEQEERQVCLPPPLPG